jgi:hypothetical protein
MLIDLQNQHSCDFDCQNRNSLLEYIALVDPAASLPSKRSNPGNVGRPRLLDRRVASLVAMTDQSERSTKRWNRGDINLACPFKAG